MNKYIISSVLVGVLSVGYLALAEEDTNKLFPSVSPSPVLKVRAQEQTDQFRKEVKDIKTNLKSDAEATKERLKKEAETHAVEDKKKRDLVEAKNQAGTLIYTAEKSLREAGDKAPDDIKKDIEEKIGALKSVMDGSDASAIAEAVSALSSALQKIGEVLYKENKGDSGNSPNEDSDSGENTDK